MAHQHRGAANPLPSPWTILNHIPAGPGENRMVRREKVFLFQGNPRFQPKQLNLFSDGSFDVEIKHKPSERDVLELIGHSKGLLCFRNVSKRKIYVWDVERERVRSVFDDVDVAQGREGSYGFGHRNGAFIVVRLGKPPLFRNGNGSRYYLHSFIERERERWTRVEVTLEALYEFENCGPAILVSQNAMLYWKAANQGGAHIITYHLQTEQVGNLVAPRDADVNSLDMVLGNGFKGQLAACVYVPPAYQRHAFLHVWVLMKELDRYHWHKLVALPCGEYTDGGDEVFVPLVFYYGQEGDEINLVMHRNNEQVVRIIPATKLFLSLADCQLGSAAVPSVLPSGLRMELASWRRIQATPLARPVSNRR